MHNSPNRGVNYHIFQNKGNYPVILIYAGKVGVDAGPLVMGVYVVAVTEAAAAHYFVLRRCMWTRRMSMR